MGSTTNILSSKYLRINEQSVKNIAIAVKIDGVSDILSSTTLYSRIRYGDPGVFYGTPFPDGTMPVYGGLRKTDGVLDYLQLDNSSLTLSQKIETEQGRSSISTLSLSFIDKDQYMTKLIGGVTIPEILGQNVTVYLGFQEISFPEDYFVIFRGKITSVQSFPGAVVFQMSDPNVNKRQNIAFEAKTNLTSSITNSSTTIPVASNGDFYKSILNISGAYDPAVKLYLKIENEIIEYGPSFSNPSGTFGTNTFGNVIRGSRGTIAASHASGTEVDIAVEIKDHPIDMALKMMLSGWNGTWLSSVPIYSFVTTGDPSILNTDGIITLPAKKDAVKDYGLIAGDQITITGATNLGNDQTVIITGFADLFGDTNRIIRTSGIFTPEVNSPALLAFRSQYDAYPTALGVKLTPLDVAVDDHVSLRKIFLGSANYVLQHFIDTQQSCKTFIESEVFLPFSLYTLTRRGKISVGLTKPPLPNQTLIILDKDTIIEPQNIKPMRATNNRKFFNEIAFKYDADDAGDFTKTLRTIDTDSLNFIGINSQLPINSKGAKSSLNFTIIAERTTQFLLNRYKRGAVLLDVKVNYGVGSRIEAGDVVGIKDDGFLQISNFSSGKRDIQTTLFEVNNRSLDLKTGVTNLQLISGVADPDKRYAVISPSSKITTGSTTTKLILKDSYGAIFPGNEGNKWTNYVGLPIRVHSSDFTFDEEVTFTGFDPSTANALLVSPALSVTPSVDWIVDIAKYSTSTDPNVNRLYKLIHAAFSPTVPIVTGIDNFNFTVSAPNATKFFIGSIVRIHNVGYSIYSPEVKVTNIVGTTITVSPTLTFTPAAGQFAEFIGFADKQQAYRWI